MLQVVSQPAKSSERNDTLGEQQQHIVESVGSFHSMSAAVSPKKFT